jgi:hypothetical protein
VRTVARHDLDDPALDLRIMAPHVAKLPMLIEKSPEGGGLELAMTRSLEELGYLSVGDPRAAEVGTWDAVVRAMQAGSALFLAATRADGDVEFRFGEATLRRAATGITMDTNVSSWLDALWLAMICRDRPRIDQLVAVPTDLVRAAYRMTFDEFFYTWMRALQTYWTSGDGLVDLVLDAMHGTDPAGLTESGKEHVLELQYPVMEMFYRLTQRDDADFNDSLATALELHKRYWSTAEYRTSPRGYVALGPLAIACLARDAGVAIDVESDYLPANLLAGTWVGEYPT